VRALRPRPRGQHATQQEGRGRQVEARADPSRLDAVGRRSGVCTDSAGFQCLQGLFRPRGRVLEVRFGYNPNSSSLGADLTPLLLLSGLLTIAVPSLLIYFQARTKKGEGSPVGAADIRQSRS